MGSMSHNVVSRNAELLAYGMIHKCFARQSYMQMSILIAALTSALEPSRTRRTLAWYRRPIS